MFLFTKENFKRVIGPSVYMFLVLIFYRNLFHIAVAEIAAFFSCRVVFRTGCRDSTIYFNYLLWTWLFMDTTFKGIIL